MVKLDKSRFIFLVVSSLTISFLYIPSLKIWALGDDFSTILVGIIDPNDRWEIFSSSGFAFRPIERVVNAIDATINGHSSTLITHVISLIGFSLSALLVFLITNYFYSEIPLLSFICTMLFIVSPNNVTSVTQIDTISQQYATVFVLFSFWWLLTKDNINQIYYYIILGISIFFALISKENPIGIIFVLPLVSGIIKNSGTKMEHKLFEKKMIITYGVIFSVFLIYIFLRFSFGLKLAGSNQYQIGLSLVSWIKNSALLLGSIVYSGSSLEIFPELQPSKVIISFLFIFCLMWSIIPYLKNLFHLIIPLSLFKIYLNKELSIYMGLIALIFSGLLPVILIGKMSELYTYLMTPFYCMLLGILFYNSLYYLKDKKPRYLYYLRCLSMICLILWLGYGTKDKIAQLVNTDKKTKQYFSIVSSLAKNHEKNEILILLSKTLSTGINDNYNVFHFSDLSILKSFSPLILKLHNKNVRYMQTQSDSISCDYILQKELNILKVARL